MMAEWLGAWDDFSLEVLGAREVGDHVLATTRQRGRGKGSGVPFEIEVTFVFTVRDSMVVRWQMFMSEQQAVETVGLAE